jgi:hypothetical protein
MYEYNRTFTPNPPHPFTPASHVMRTHLPLHIIIRNESLGVVYNYTAWKNINATEFTDQKLLCTGVPISPQPHVLSVVFCLMVRIFRLMLVLSYI